MRGAFRSSLSAVVPIVLGALLLALVSVLWATPAAAENSVVYDGHVHTSTGEATVTNNGDGTLTVSNIGSSGQDGVYAQFGNPDSVAVEYAPINIFVPGRRMVWQVQVAIPGGTANVPTILRRSGGAVDLLASLSSLGVSNVTVEAYLDEALVESATVSPAGQMARLYDIGGGIPVDSFAFVDGALFHHLSTGVGIQLPGKSPVLADAILVRPSAGPVAARPTALLTQAANLPSILTTNETIEIFDNSLISGRLGTRLNVTGPDGPIGITNLGGPGTTAGIDEPGVITCPPYCCLTCTLTMGKIMPMLQVAISPRALSNQGDKFHPEVTGTAFNLGVVLERMAASTQVCPTQSGAPPSSVLVEVTQGGSVLFSDSLAPGACTSFGPRLSVSQVVYNEGVAAVMTVVGQMQGVGPVELNIMFETLTDPPPIQGFGLGATWPSWAITNITR